MVLDFHAHLDRDPITKEYDVTGLLQDMEENKIDQRVVSTFYGASMSAANDKIIELVRPYPDKMCISDRSITISNSSGLSDEEIERMVKEAEEHKAEDEKRKEEAELKNKAEAFINQIDTSIAEAGDKIDAKQKEETMKLRDELQKALDENDMESVKSKLDALEKAAQAASEAMYQQQAQQGADAGSANNNDDNVVDADFKEKN